MPMHAGTGSRLDEVGPRFGCDGIHFLGRGGMEAGGGLPRANYTRLVGHLPCCWDTGGPRIVSRQKPTLHYMTCSCKDAGH